RDPAGAVQRRDRVRRSRFHLLRRRSQRRAPAALDRLAATGRRGQAYAIGSLAIYWMLERARGLVVTRNRVARGARGRLSVVIGDHPAWPASALGRREIHPRCRWLASRQMELLGSNARTGPADRETRIGESFRIQGRHGLV